MSMENTVNDEMVEKVMRETDKKKVKDILENIYLEGFGDGEREGYEAGFAEAINYSS